MNENTPRHLPTPILNRISLLRNTSKIHLDLLAKILRADGGNIFGVDLVVCAVIQRSLSLIDGFATMVECRNVLCAAPLIRLQLDSIIRLYACWLVDDPHSIALHLLEKGSLKKIKSRDGKSLTDRYLHQEASKVYPWLSRVYEKTSGFVHLSSPQMLSFVRSIDAPERTAHVSIQTVGPQWDEGDILETVDAFTEATKALLHLCRSWLTTKDSTRPKNTHR